MVSKGAFGSDDPSLAKDCVGENNLAS